MPVIPSPIVGVMAILSDDSGIAAVTSGRIFGAEWEGPTDSKEAPPGVVVRGAGGSRVFGEASFIPVGAPRIDVLSFGPTPHAAHELSGRCIWALKQWRAGVAGGVKIFACHPEGSYEGLADPDTEWRYDATSWQVVTDERSPA